MGLSQARGLLLEEVVLRLLELVGYRPVAAGEEDTRLGGAGLEVQGRGEWHQADAFAAWDYTPAFTFPLRLVLEAKCYSQNRAVSLPVVRGVVGLVKDLSENFFSFIPQAAPSQIVRAKRFNYNAAIFSTGGYTAAAQRYAVAHQVFLIQYERIALMQPVIQGLMGLSDRHLGLSAGGSEGAMTHLRQWARARLRVLPEPSVAECGLSGAGRAYIIEQVFAPLNEIKGSYFGTLNGKWPMHLLAAQALPPDLFAHTDVVKCQIVGRDSNRWSFIPSGVREGAPGWFRLEFDLPDEVAEMVLAARRDAIEVAQIKKAQFATLDIAGVIGGIRRSIRLELDEDWLHDYVSARRARVRQGGW